MPKLTDREFSPTPASLNDLIHAVVTGDTTQDVAGSSYKASMKQYSDIILSLVPKDIYVTGGTYSTGAAVFTNNIGGTFTVNGFPSGVDVFVTSGVYQKSTDIATFTNNTGGTFTVTGFNGNLQKIIVSTYTIENADNGYTILINNGVNPVTINIPVGLMDSISVGFIQQGSGDVTIAGVGTTIRTPIVGAYRIKGMNYNAYVEQIGTSNNYHLLGNIKV